MPHDAGERALFSDSRIHQVGAALFWAALLWVSLVLIFAWELPWLAILIASVATAAFLVAIAVEQRTSEGMPHRRRSPESVGAIVETRRAA
jgi:hypothetical protein